MSETPELTQPPRPTLPLEPVARYERAHWAYRWLRRLAYTFYFLFLVAFGLVAALVVLVETPRVQNLLVPALNRYLQKTLQTEVHVRRVEIQLFDKIAFYDVVLKDQQGHTILGAKRIRIGMLSLGLWKLIAHPEQEHLITARLIELVEPEFRIYSRRADGKLNLSFLFPKNTQPDTTRKPPFLLSAYIGQLKIVNGKLWACDSTAPLESIRPKAGHLNYKHVKFDKLNFEGTAELYRMGALKVDIRHVSGREIYSGLVLKHFEANYWCELGIYPLMTDPWFKDQYAPNWEAVNVKAHLGNSVMDFDLRMLKETMLSIVKTKGNRRFEVTFRPSVLDFHTIDYFSPIDIPPKGLLRVEGRVYGDYKTLRSKRLKLGLGQRTRLDASVRVSNYTKPENFFMELDLQPSTIDPQDAFVLLPTLNLPKELKRVGLTTVEGYFGGFFTDFVARASFQAAAGFARSDLRLRFDRKKRELSYSGNLETRNLDLDTLLDIHATQRLNFTGFVQGKGLDIETVELEARFRMATSLIRGEEVDSANGRVTLDRGLVEGELQVRDNSGDFNGLVNLNLSDSIPTYRFRGDVRRLNLHKLGLTDQELLLTTIGNVDMQGNTLDDIRGYARLLKITLERPDTVQVLRVEDLVGRLEENSLTGKRFTLKGSKERRRELFNLVMEGNFSFSQADTLVRRLVREAKLFLLNDSVQIREYYARRAQKLPDQLNFDFALQTGDVAEVLRFLRIPAYISPNARARGQFRSGQVDAAQVRIIADSLVLDSFYRMRYVQVDLSLTKPANENQLNASGVLKVSRLQIGKGLEFQQLFLRPYWAGEHIDYLVSFRQDSFRNVVRLAGTLDYAPGLVVNQFDADQSSLQVGDSLWLLSPGNRIRVTPNSIQVDSLSLLTSTQEIFINGLDNGYQSEGITLRVSQLQLRSLNNFLPSRLSLAGEANVEFVLRNLLNEPILELNGRVRRLAYAGLSYGDLALASDWNQAQNRLQLQASLIGKSDTLLNLAGSYDPKALQNSLDFNLLSDNLPVALIQPFVQGILYEMEGQIDIQDLHIGGTLAKPIVQGYALVDARFGIDYFRTKYSIRHRVRFNETNIFFDDLNLVDVNRNRAVIYGYIYHQNFSRFNFDIQFKEIRNFLLANTTNKDNNLFYGRMFIRRGFGFIEGELSRINITANVETANGTEVSIPISSYREGQSLDYVFFRQRGSKQRYPNTQNKAIGLSLNLTISATPDATLRLIFDEKVGDIIKGRGTGTITLGLTQGGEFSMTGGYTVTEGNYTFTLQNFIRKEFGIRPGGTITWTGDPLQAEMNLQAVYSRVVSASSLLASAGGRFAASSDSVQSSIPTDVLMNLTGNLLNPSIQFAIQLPNLNAESAFLILTALNAIQNDQQELNRQVFSLLLFNRFAPLGNFLGEGNAVGGVTSSVSEFVSSQFNYWLSQALGSDNVGVNVSSREFNEVFLSVRAQLFNKRVTVERNGVLVSSRQRDFSIGNLSVQVRILPLNLDRARPGYGVMAFEVFQRENLGMVNNIASVNRGLGVFLKQDFDSLRELFRRLAQDERRRKEERDANRQKRMLKPTPPPTTPEPETTPRNR